MRERSKEMINAHQNDKIDRREFIHKSMLLAGSLAAAGGLHHLLGTPLAHAAQVDPSDSELISSETKFAATDGVSITGYLTRPKGEGRHPAVVVIHEWRGQNDHIKDVARRLAKQGYVALAPDLLSRLGGTASFPSGEAATKGLYKLGNDVFVKDLTGAVNYLKAQNYVRADRIGVIGFCWGGALALLFTTRNKDLAASVIYYGHNPSNLDDVKNITAPVLAHYGEKDGRITSAVPKLEDAMKKYGKSFEYKVYPGAPHAFNNDTNQRSYRDEAAKKAWARTLAFFKKHLQS
jgi:carboxymethylenebutenolidase